MGIIGVLFMRVMSFASETQQIEDSLCLQRGCTQFVGKLFR
jgi:hypothetical protein